MSNPNKFERRGSRRKQSLFFEKDAPARRSKKTFAALKRADETPRTEITKSFLVTFFQKSNFFLS
jgi:hypothetical protein